MPRLTTTSSSGLEPARSSGAPKPAEKAPPAASEPHSGCRVTIPVPRQRAMAGNLTPAPIGSKIQAGPLNRWKTRRAVGQITAGTVTRPTATDNVARPVSAPPPVSGVASVRRRAAPSRHAETRTHGWGAIHCTASAETSQGAVTAW